jgi:hypothetical protein
MKNDFSHMGKKWPSSIVSRQQIREFTGGMLSPGTLANLDCQGIGPDGRIRIGKKVGYIVDRLIPWLERYAERGE